MKFRIVTFSEIGFRPIDYQALDILRIRAQAIQLACDFLMDSEFSEFNEPDVIGPHEDVYISWHEGTIAVPVKQVYKPEYLQ